jgi:hypothetical protein
MDVRFFLGRGSHDSLPDETCLDVDDGYDALPSKVQRMIQWALAKGYQKVCKIDSDIVEFYPDRLLAVVPQEDYVGFVNNSVVPYCSGFCYVLSERAMRIVADAEIPEGELAEDRFVGGALNKAGIHPYPDPRFIYFKPPVWQLTCPPESAIAICDCSEN